MHADEEYNIHVLDIHCPAACMTRGEQMSWSSNLKLSACSLFNACDADQLEAKPVLALQ